MTARPVTTVLVITAAALAGGCADPYQQDPAAPSKREDRPASDAGGAPTPPQPSGPNKPQLPAPPASGELPGEVPAELADEPTSFPEARQTPQQTVALGALLYGNWTSANAAERFGRIAALSVGQARAELRQAAAQTAADPQQQGLRSKASVQAIEIHGRGALRRALVVTRQKVEGPGLPETGWRYQVTTAQLHRRDGKWVIARWRPQP